MPTEYSLVIADTSVITEFGKQLPDWILIDSSADHQYQRLLAQEVDVGEASATALSLKKENALLILDDRRARKLAQNCGFFSPVHWE